MTVSQHVVKSRMKNFAVAVKIHLCSVVERTTCRCTARKNKYRRKSHTLKLSQLRVLTKLKDCTLFKMMHHREKRAPFEAKWKGLLNIRLNFQKLVMVTTTKSHLSTEKELRFSSSMISYRVSEMRQTSKEVFASRKTPSFLIKSRHSDRSR